jgi:hypothetical protein
MGARGSDSDSGNHGSNPGPPARESASNRCVFVVSSLAGIVLKLPRVSSPANASAATRDAKCLGAGRERPQGLSRPFSSRRMWSVSARQTRHELERIRQCLLACGVCPATAATQDRDEMRCLTSSFSSGRLIFFSGTPGPPSFSAMNSRRCSCQSFRSGAPMTHV